MKHCRHLGTTTVKFDVALYNSAGVFTAPSEVDPAWNNVVQGELMSRVREGRMSGDLLRKGQRLLFSGDYWPESDGVEVLAEVVSWTNGIITMSNDFDKHPIHVERDGLWKLIRDAKCAFVFDEKRVSDKIPRITAGGLQPIEDSPIALSEDDTAVGTTDDTSIIE